MASSSLLHYVNEVLVFLMVLRDVGVRQVPYLAMGRKESKVNIVIKCNE
jgi:hypothetical protein